MEEINVKVCAKCGATWINNQHYWSGTGNIGNPHDLAGLVCNRVDSPECINPCKGSISGDTWEKRSGTLDESMKKMKD
mgnify:FL=1|jgi:hypothetical protein